MNTRLPAPARRTHGHAPTERLVTPPLGECGYSLTELFVALTLVSAVVVGVSTAANGTLQTYKRDAAAREILAEIRSAQSLAVTRGGVYVFEWNPSDGRYRVVRDATGDCSLPEVDAGKYATNVVGDWEGEKASTSGTKIQSIKDRNGKSVSGIMFNSLGASVNTCASVSFPITATITDDDGTARSIEIKAAGSTRLL